MKVIQSTLEQRGYSQDLAQRVCPDTETTEDQRFYGILGEVVICDILGIQWPKYEGPDGGWDLIINDRKIDVKTKQTSMANISNNFEHHVMSYQVDKYDPDFYLFCVSKDDYKTKGYWVIICGIIRKTDFLDKSKRARSQQEDMGSEKNPRSAKYDTYQITQGHLNPIYTDNPDLDIIKAVDELNLDEHLGVESKQDPITQAQEQGLPLKESWEDEFLK